MLNLLPRQWAPCHIAVGMLLSLGLPGSGVARAEADPAAEVATKVSVAPRAVSAPKAVVELFTSQGCSSCPPADKLLGQLAAGEDVLALTLAVDYWDYLGWKDTLAKHGHSVRQKSYAKMRGDGKLFTPQMIFNGAKMAVGNDATAVSAAFDEIAPLPVPVRLSVVDGRLIAQIGAGTGHGEVWVCPVSSAATVQIGRGENEGATMTYHNVVRGWVRLGEWTGAAAEFSIRLAEIEGATVDSAAVLVQAGGQGTPGPILGAALQPIP